MPILLPTAVSLLQRGILSYHPLPENRDVPDTDNSACTWDSPPPSWKPKHPHPSLSLLLLCPPHGALPSPTALTSPIQLNSGLWPYLSLVHHKAWKIFLWQVGSRVANSWLIPTYDSGLSLRATFSHLSPTRLARPKVGELVRERHSHILLVEYKLVQSFWRAVWQQLSKGKMHCTVICCF